MKNQYFGDNKDLFTYDLIFHVMQAVLVNHFTFIPMLTYPDDTGYGGRQSVIRQRWGIAQLNNFFIRYTIKMTTYYGKEKYFSHKKGGNTLIK